MDLRGFFKSRKKKKKRFEEYCGYTKALAIISILHEKWRLVKKYSLIMVVKRTHLGHNISYTVNAFKFERKESGSVSHFSFSG